MALLELDGVRAGYGQTRVLHGVSLSVGEGDVVALLGANGAGKTTTLRAITGGVRWDGIINFGGRSLRRGEQQMLALARALLMKPKLLLLDEPSLGLAPLVVRSIFDIIRAINESDHVAVLLVGQNARIALELSSHAYVLEVGRVAVEGESAQLKTEESVRRSYLGY